jgi:hypothetical protein
MPKAAAYAEQATRGVAAGCFGSLRDAAGAMSIIVASGVRIIDHFFILPPCAA